jgi:hypothetical protein
MAIGCWPFSPRYFDAVAVPRIILALYGLAILAAVLSLHAFSYSLAIGIPRKAVWSASLCSATFSEFLGALVRILRAAARMAYSP